MAGMRIGLTGGIAAGKSTVARRLAQLGAYVIDYDLLARRVVAPGGEALRRIVAEFGPEACNPDGTLNRSWIADRIFGSDPHARRRLDAIEHPLIYREAARLESTHPTERIIVHDIPLLAEVLDGIPFSFDRIVTVEAPETERIERMVATRGMSRRQALERISHQSTQRRRRAIADEVIDSSQPMANMMQVVDRLYTQWVKER